MLKRLYIYCRMIIAWVCALGLLSAQIPLYAQTNEWISREQAIAHIQSSLDTLNAIRKAVDPRLNTDEIKKASGNAMDKLGVSARSRDEAFFLNQSAYEELSSWAKECFRYHQVALEQDLAFFKGEWPDSLAWAARWTVKKTYRDKLDRGMAAFKKRIQEVTDLLSRWIGAEALKALERDRSGVGSSKEAAYRANEIYNTLLQRLQEQLFSSGVDNDMLAPVGHQTPGSDVSKQPPADEESAIGRDAEAKVLARSCPTFLHKAVANDYRSGIIETCVRPNIPKSIETAPEEKLEAFLLQEPSLIDGIPHDFSVSTACPPLAEFSQSDNTWIRMQVTAEYYLSRRRLLDGILASLESLASLDAIKNMDCVGEPDNIGKSFSPRFLPDIKCKDDFVNMPTCLNGCYKLKRDCGDSFDFSSITQQTEFAMRQSEAIGAEIERLRQRWGRDLNPGFNAGSRRTWEAEQPREKVKQLTSLLDLIKNSNPWLEGAAFKARYNELYSDCKRTRSNGAGSCEAQSLRFVCEAMRAQVAETAKAIQDHLAKFRRALTCLDGPGSGCGLSSGEFREIVALAPIFEGIPTDRSEPGYLKNMKAFANGLIYDVECRTEQEGASLDRKKAYLDFAIGAGITVITGGLGTASRLATLAATSRTAGSAAKAARAARMASAAKKLERAALLIDLADVGRGLTESIQDCGNAFRLTTAVQSVSPDGPQCPGEDYEGAKVIQGYRSCVLQAIAWELATGLLPLAPTAVSRAIDNSILRQSAEALGVSDLRNVSELKRTILLDVFRKRLAPEDAAKALREAGFNQDEIYKLFKLMPGASTLTDVQKKALAAGRPLSSDVNEAERAFAAWKNTLNPETLTLLNNNKNLERLFRGMDRKVRRALTRCNSPCIPPGASPEDVDRITEIISKHNLDGPDLDLLNDYFYQFRGNLDGAITLIKGSRSANSLRNFVSRLNSVTTRFSFEDDDLSLLLDFFLRRRNALVKSLSYVESRPTLESLRAFVKPVPGRIFSYGTKLPDGTKIFTPVTLADGKTVAVAYQVGDPIRRAGHEQMFDGVLPPRKGMQRGHLVPPGHGVEDPGGLAYNTRYINQSLDPRIDNMIRRAYLKAKADGNKIHVIAAMRRHDDGTIAFKQVQVTLVLPNKQEYSIFTSNYSVKPDGAVASETFNKGQKWSVEYEPGQ
jgi:hypothetical protein